MTQGGFLLTGFHNRFVGEWSWGSAANILWPLFTSLISSGRWTPWVVTVCGRPPFNGHGVCNDLVFKATSHFEYNKNNNASFCAPFKDSEQSWHCDLWDWLVYREVVDTAKEQITFSKEMTPWKIANNENGRVCFSKDFQITWMRDYCSLFFGFLASHIVIC